MDMICLQVSGSLQDYVAASYSWSVNSSCPIDLTSLLYGDISTAPTVSILNPSAYKSEGNWLVVQWLYVICINYTDR